MKYFKKFIIMATMFAMLVGCSSGNTNSSSQGTVNNNDNSNSNNQAVSGTESTDLDPVDLIFYVMGDEPKDKDVVLNEVNKILKEKFNATLDFRFSTWTDFQQKYVNQLTSGGADLIYVANWLDFGTLANSGAFLELDDLIDQYGTDLREVLTDGVLDMCRVGGELYAIPNAWPEFVPLGVTYREDLRQKYDLPVPNSLENMEAYFLGIRENDPQQPILKVTADDSQGFAIAFDAAQVLNIKYPWVQQNGLNYGLSAYYDSPMEITDYWYSDDFLEDSKMFKRWADAGFWSKSALSDSNDSDAYKNGLSVAQVSGMNPNKQIAAATDFIASGNPDWISGYFAYGEATGVMYPGHATQNATAIVRSSKNPERAMMVLNYIFTDKEMNQLVQCGIEGVHYELDENGHYVNISDSFMYENFNTWNLRDSRHKLLQPTDIELQKMFDRYKEISDNTRFPNVNIADGFNENYEDYQAERAAVSNVMRQYLAPLQAGLVDDVEAAVNEFRERMTAAGIEKVRAAYKEQWLAYCEEYGYK